jgi:hypothetical protein
MVTKQCHVVRYSPMLARATGLIRRLLLANAGSALDDERPAVEAATTYTG